MPRRARAVLPTTGVGGSAGRAHLVMADVPSGGPVAVVEAGKSRIEVPPRSAVAAALD